MGKEEKPKEFQRYGQYILIDNMTPEDRRIVEEQIYRAQLIHSHGYAPDDERLKSRDKI